MQALRRAGDVDDSNPLRVGPAKHVSSEMYNLCAALRRKEHERKASKDGKRCVGGWPRDVEGFVGCPYGLCSIERADKREVQAWTRLQPVLSTMPFKATLHV